MMYQLSDIVSVVIIVVALRQIVDNDGLVLVVPDRQRLIGCPFVFSAFLQHPDWFLLGLRWRLRILITRWVTTGFLRHLLFRRFLLLWCNLVTARWFLFILFVVLFVCILLVFLALLLFVLFGFLVFMSLRLRITGCACVTIAFPCGTITFPCTANAFGGSTGGGTIQVGNIQFGFLGRRLFII